jgi:nitroreductase
MELGEAIRRRAMVRSFAPRPVDIEVVRRLLHAALRAPTAGNARGTAWVALVGPEQTQAYWSATTDEEWRSRNAARSQGLSRAPVVLLAYASPEAYVARYGEADKARSGLGAGAEAWPVPYWFGDAAFGVMTVLLAAVEAGLGACVLGAFRGEAALASALHVPEEWRLFSAVALGHPDGEDRAARSLGRARPPASSRVHWGVWGSPADPVR